MGIKKDLSKKLEAIAIDEQGNIEAFTNKEKSILGIMWHPEREKPYKKNDIELVKNFYGNKSLILAAGQKT